MKILLLPVAWDWNENHLEYVQFSDILYTIEDFATQELSIIASKVKEAIRPAIQKDLELGFLDEDRIAQSFETSDVVDYLHNYYADSKVDNAIANFQSPTDDSLVWDIWDSLADFAWCESRKSCLQPHDEVWDQELELYSEAWR